MIAVIWRELPLFTVMMCIKYNCERLVVHFKNYLKRGVSRSNFPNIECAYAKRKKKKETTLF